jgi:hypothetical protein
MMRKDIVLVLIVLTLGFLVRLYRFDNPIADWHSWRQADTSAVSRNFVNYGFDILHPRFDDLSNVASGMDNPQGYRFVEFPLYNILQAGLFKIFGVLTLEEWGRLVSIFSSLFAGVFIFLIVNKYLGFKEAFFSLFFYLFLPFSVFFGRTILPDTAMVAALLGGIYFFILWAEEVKNQTTDKHPRSILKPAFFFGISCFLIASSFLLKPFAIFFALPLVVVAYQNFGFSFIKRLDLWLFAAFSLLPLLFWRVWILQYPQGIPASAWLFNGDSIRFKGAFFYWIFSDRIGRLILGYWGLMLLGFGLIKKNSKESSLFFSSFLVSTLVYLFVVATGNVRHDYYQIPIIPTIAIYLGMGASFLLSKEGGNNLLSKVLLVVCTVFMLSFSWYFIRDYFNINNPSIIKAGEAVRRLTPKEAKIVAPYNGDTALLYQTERQGWPSFSKPLPDLISSGADFLLLVNPKPQDRDIGRQYKIVEETSDFILFDLHKKP